MMSCTEMGLQSICHTVRYKDVCSEVVMLVTGFWSNARTPYPPTGSDKIGCQSIIITKAMILIIKKAYAPPLPGVYRQSYLKKVPCAPPDVPAGALPPSCGTSYKAVSVQ